MKLRIIFHASIFIATSAVMTTGCASESPIDTSSENIGQAIIFQASDTTESRGTSIGKEDLESFRLYAYQFHNGGNPFCSINGEIAYPTENGDWKTEETYYWPDKSRSLKFIAYAPTDEENLKLVNPWETDPTNIHFYYSCPHDVKAQKDIIFSITRDAVNYGGTDQRVSLWFTHILASVKFKLRGTDATRVKSITLNGVYGEGIYYPSWDSWHIYGYDGGPAFKTDYTVYFTPDGKVSDDQTIMIIPQTAPSGATIDIRLRDGTFKSADFSYKTLHAGSQNTINISL